MLRASIDIGSNTVLLLVADVIDEGFTEHENETRVTSLGKDLDKTGEFHEQSMADSYEAFKDYSTILKKYEFDPQEVLVTATEASRVAKNSGEFFEKIQKDFGFEVKIISPDAEAHYCAYGVVAGAGLKDEEEVLIMDIGGASTEFMQVRLAPFKIKKTISLPMGSVRGTDWISEGNFDQKMSEILAAPELEDFKTDHLLCVAGSMTSLGGMIKGLSVFDSTEINGAKISFENFEKFVAKIMNLEPDTLLKQYPFLGKRSQSIVAGARLGLRVGQRLDIKTFEISTLGLRYGTLLEGVIHEHFIV